MVISIQLDEITEKRLKDHLHSHNDSITEFIHQAINEKLAHNQSTLRNPYEIGKNLFGRHSSGQSGLSTKHKSILKEKLHNQHSR